MNASGKKWAWTSTPRGLATSGDSTINRGAVVVSGRATPPRALRLLPHGRAAPVVPAQGRAHRRLDHRQRGGVGHRAPDGPPGPPRPAGRDDGARCAELGVARLRDARGLLA